jgi:hypothetical protein
MKRYNQTPSLAQRRAFVQLPIEKRRRLLERAARKLANHYLHDPEWRELERGDLVEYECGDN